MLENRARGQRSEPTRLEEFDPPSTETFGLHYSAARSVPGGDGGLSDLFHGTLPNEHFAALSCDTTRFAPVDLQGCRMWFDWRPGLLLSVRFRRSHLPEWREIGAATLRLIDALQIEEFSK
jgi:hypothetical protein